ncbi:GSCOCG00012520001-RA-CDS [Cotesia congregata]|nr:GSCOCG00012520001-RA-CDS [Cotesia congregata]
MNFFKSLIYIYNFWLIKKFYTYIYSFSTFRDSIYINIFYSFN